MFFFLSLMLNVSINSYGHVGTVRSLNHKCEIFQKLGPVVGNFLNSKASWTNTSIGGKTSGSTQKRK